MANPQSTAIQFAMCYGLMPLISLGLGRAFGLSPEIIAGEMSSEAMDH